MLHKAAHSFSPFKLQHLHSHIRSALNLNLGQNAGQNFNQAASSTASSASASASSASGSGALGSAAGSAGGAGGNAKYHAGRSYGYHYYYGRTTTPAANALTSNDPSANSKQLLDDEDSLAAEAAASSNASASSKLRAPTERSLRWRTGRSFAGRQRSSSLSNPGLTTGLPLDSPSTSTSSSSSITASGDPSILPRSSPYSFNQAQLQARYRHAFSQAKRPSHERLLTLPGQKSIPQQQQQRVISTCSTPSSSSSFSSSTFLISSEQPLATIPEYPKTAPSSPRLSSSKSLPSSSLRHQQLRRNSTSTVNAAPSASQPLDAVDIDAPKAPSTVAEPSQPQSQQEREPRSVSEEVLSEDLDIEAASQLETADEPAAGEKLYPENNNVLSRVQHPNSFPRFSSAPLNEDDMQWRQATSQYTRAGDVSQLRLLSRSYRLRPETFTKDRHEHLINQFRRIRMHADVTEDVLELYGDFFEHDMVPSIEAHSIATATYAERSQATLQILKKQQMQNNVARLAPAASAWAEGTPFSLEDGNNTAAGNSAEFAGMFEDSSLAALRQQSDQDYVTARDLLKSLGPQIREVWPIALDALLEAAAERGDIDTGLSLFGALEATPRHLSQATHRTFANLILTYARARDERGMFTVFETYAQGADNLTRSLPSGAREHLTQESKDVVEPTFEQLPFGSVTFSDRSGTSGASHLGTKLDVWNAAVYGYLLVNDGVKALEVLERMMADSKKVPKPAESTLLKLVGGFAEAGDLDAAFRWANRIHSQPPPADLPTPPTLEDTLNAIIAATSDIGALQEAAAKTPLLPQLGSHIKQLAAPLQDTPQSPISSADAGSSISNGLGSLFSDISSRTRTMSITPPPHVGNMIPAAEAPPIDLHFSSMLDDLCRRGRGAKEAYGIIKAEAREGKHAHPETLMRVAHLLATEGEALTSVEDLYKIASEMISSVPAGNEQTAAWAYIEDKMLSARARVGQLEQAALHRDRLLAAGAAPSADSYAAMITSAKDTTDDATVALELFEEARRFGVVPNLFLFNILISKLSKARRTQLALSYFEQMKAIGIRPSAVSYGSVIAACCRTGDEKAATYLFREMVSAPGFKPRVPPYNTMIQFFISTKPDREKALSYFDAMLHAGVRPTGHTYKLLLDAYGTLAPADLESVKDVFSRLISDDTVTVTGNHWASLIHAYGSVQKNLADTMEIFDSIATHPASQLSKITMPDVICYEALFNALMAMERVDLIEQYLHRMRAQFVRPTAYIYNTLIRAHAVTGNLEQARAIFESLADPPSGVAAAGNHASEKEKKPSGAEDPAVDAAKGAPVQASSNNMVVYREPSTYEAMIKAEAAAGETEKAHALVQRAIARAFPTAIIAKLERMASGHDNGSPAFGSIVTAT